MIGGELVGEAILLSDRSCETLVPSYVTLRSTQTSVLILLDIANKMSFSLGL